MIKEDNVFCHAGNPKNKVDRKSVGKWITFGKLEIIISLFNKLAPLTDSGNIYQMKYTHKKDYLADPFPNDLPMICIYADDKTKQNTLKEINNVISSKKKYQKLSELFWKYNSEIKKDWEKGGKLREKYERELGLKIFLNDPFNSKK